MPDENLTWPQAIVESAGRIATPVSQHAVFIIALTFFGCSIAGIEKIDTWKGCLLSGVLAIFVGIAATSIWMAIYKPRNLTFDKEANKLFNVTQAEVAVPYDTVDVYPADPMEFDEPR